MKVMCEFDSQIENISKIICEKAKSWISEGSVIDPIDRKAIPAHYSDTHFAVAFLLQSRDDTCYFDVAKRIMESFIAEWPKRKELPGYHADFNNFALCLFFNELEDREIRDEFQEKIKNIILAAEDSHNYTINWLPMRIYVNYYRYLLTHDEKYLESCDKLEQIVLSAINADGSIEDRMPKGVSFNIQYNVSTVAELIFLKEAGYSFKKKFNLELLVSRVLAMVAPDGDINYMGRGCNQIFAWGPWLYVLKYANNVSLEKHACFFFSNIIRALRNNNLLLNDFPGDQKLYWWDYHYCSVYYGHLLMWLKLVMRQVRPNSKIVAANDDFESFKRVKTTNYETMSFNGRKEYWCEMGPSLSYIWSNRYGMIFKGNYGPWRGHFGNYHTLPSYVLRNSVGLMSLRQKSSTITNRILDRLGIVINQVPMETIKPFPAKCEVLEDDYVLILRYHLAHKTNAYFNFPMFSSIAINDVQLTVFADGEELKSVCVGSIVNQYGMCNLFESEARSAKYWEVKLKINEWD